MADYYNVAGLMNSTSMYGVTTSLNDATNGIIVVSLMLVSLVVMLFIMRNNEFKVQLLSALGFVLIEGVLFFALGMIPISYVVTVLGLIVMCVIWVVWT